MFYSGQCERNYQSNPSTFSLFWICINEIFLDDPLFMILVLSPISLMGSTTVHLKTPLHLRRKGKEKAVKKIFIYSERIARKR